MNVYQIESRNMIIPDPECTGGFTQRQVAEIMGDKLPDFRKWMSGQTMMLCEGKKFNQETRQYEEECGGIVHGPVTYSWDLRRYLGIIPGKDIWD